MRDADWELVRRARQGDETAYRELVDQYAGGLFGLARSLVGNNADAEDILQETLLGAFKGIKGFEGRSSVKTWLAGIAVKQAAMCLRSRSAHKTVSLGQLAEPAESGLRGHKYNEGPSSVDIRADVLAALQTLSVAHREVISLRELEGMSYEEISVVLGIPRGTVESRLFRARRELKDRLKGYFP